MEKKNRDNNIHTVSLASASGFPKPLGCCWDRSASQKLSTAVYNCFNPSKH